MTIKGLAEVRQNYLIKHWTYGRWFYKDFNYKILENCIYRKSHKFSNTTFNDITIMIDTETSKPEPLEDDEYSDVVYDISTRKFKYNEQFKEVATKDDFANYGIHFGGTTCVDVCYEELKDEYPWIFKEECYSDLDAIYELYVFMMNHVPEEPVKDNIVVVWTLSIRLFDLNICTLYGRKPSELNECIGKILEVLQGDKTYVYIFNLGYDYVFLRKFFNRDFDLPIKQLNVKPHYPISIEYNNGLILKDALILAQRKLSKWAEDLKVEHQKAIGDWDYTIVRHQYTPLSDDELHYAEFDTLSGVECIDALKNQLDKNIGTMPLTSTGILRELLKKVGAKNDARKWFLSCCPTFKQYEKMTKLFHGGYTHGNRHLLGKLIKKYVMGFDFASSYPFALFFKYPIGKFLEIDNCSKEFILKNSEEYAFMFKLIMVQPELKDDSIPMPFLQYSKAEYEINSIVDNGRVIAADYFEIYLNEIDLAIINEQYKCKASLCVEVEAACKDYLPRWFTDIVFDLFKDKTSLKHVDDILYVIQKYKLNACFGLCCQRWDKPEIIETEDGEYIIDDSLSAEELFNKHIKKRSTILPYFIGCWCTSYAARNLFRLGSMCEIWLYSDTDSCYGLNWDIKKVEEYNQECITFMQERGYSGVEHEGKMYYLGVAENEDDTNYTEFIYHGAKRYAGRCAADKEIHITVAGVPKKTGAKCLNNDLRNFKKDFVFDGKTTGKLTHTHNYIDDIYINEYGDEVGDSIDLTPCDYKLDTTKYHTLDEYMATELNITLDVPADTTDIDLLFN